MKEILIKFESEKDYENFINNVIIPSLKEDEKEWDSENNILILKDKTIKQV